MASSLPFSRQLFASRTLCQGLVSQMVPRRALHTIWSSPKEKIPIPKDLPPQFQSQIPTRLKRVNRTIKVAPKPKDPSDTCKDPIAEFEKQQMAILDPTGERKALFDKRNREGVKVGDILRVTFKSGDPFNGVCLNIRSRGIDSGFLLRNHLTKLPVEMWVKVFNPNVQSVEIVQRTEKRMRRARLTYMRQPKHDIGSVDNIVSQYLRQKAILASGAQKSGGQRSGNR